MTQTAEATTPLTPEPPEVSKTSGVATALRAFARHRIASAALVVFVVFVLTACLSSVLPFPDPNRTDITRRLLGISWSHLLGTDELGRDQLSRILAAARISMWAALQATVVGLVLGVPLGLVTGLLGGRLDAVVSRIYDAVQSIPPLILAIAIVAVLGRNLTPAMIAIGIVFSPGFYRVSRAASSTVAHETYMEASRSMGQTTGKIVVTHVLGNVSAALIVQTSTTLAFGILAEAALSYLGLGVQPPSASLGSMMTSAANLLNSSPQLTIVPGLVILLLVLCISLVSDAIGDVASVKAGR